MEPSNEFVSRDVESINNLDTAKMTLRWALERLRSVEDRRQALEKQLDDTRSALLAQSQARKDKESYWADWEEYHKRMEALLADYCKGSLDVKALLEREVEAERAGRELAERRAELERQAAERQHKLECQFKKMQAELEIGAAKQSRLTEESLEERKVQMDKAYVSRELALRAAEHQLDARDSALKELEKRLESLYLERKGVLEAQYRGLKRQTQEEAELRLSEWEKEQTLRAELLEGQWRAQKAALDEQAKRWEAQARELLARIEVLDKEKLQAQRALIAKEEEAQARVRVLEQDYRASEAALTQRGGVIEAEAEQSLRRLREELSSQAEADRKRRAEEAAQSMTACELRVRRLEEALAAERSKAAAVEAEYARREAEAEAKRTAETEAHRQRVKELTAALGEESSRTAALQEEHLRKEAEAEEHRSSEAEARLQELRQRERDLQESWAARRRDLEAEIETRRRELDSHAEELRLQSRNIAEHVREEHTLRVAEARVRELEKALDAERSGSRGLSASLDAARAELSSFKESCLRREADAEAHCAARMEALTEELHLKAQVLQDAWDKRRQELERDFEARAKKLGADLSELAQAQAGHLKAPAEGRAAALESALTAERGRSQELLSALDAVRGELASLKKADREALEKEREELDAEKLELKRYERELTAGYSLKKTELSLMKEKLLKGIELLLGRSKKGDDGGQTQKDA